MLKTRLIEPADPGSAATHTPTSGLAAAAPKLAGVTPPRGQDARDQFEQLRLAAFAHRGFAGEGRRIPDRAGRESYALVSGDGPCPTVLVHGGVDNTIEWAEIAARLDGPVVIPDRPGFGLSHPHNYYLVDFRNDAVRWLLELADGVGMQQIDLVGNSMGGFFAIAFAAAHPERVRRLILSGSAAGLFPGSGCSCSCGQPRGSARSSRGSSSGTPKRSASERSAATWCIPTVYRRTCSRSH